VKVKLSFWQIVNMNVGFFGLQYSFGLQQANMSPIYTYLGAEESKLPLLWLAGPVTGLIIQPIIGALSDRTTSKWGRRSPYFLIGAIICSICLFFMPKSSSVWMAASILWILDAANNVTQEPYRAFVSDKLDKDQHSAGFLMQSAFTGLGQTLSYLTPTLLLFFGISKTSANTNHIPTTTLIAFTIGAIVSISSILWSLKTTKESPLSDEELQVLKKQSKSVGAIFREIIDALRAMPLAMRQMIPMMFFSWYGIFIYWIYISKSLAFSVYGTTNPLSSGFRNAEFLSGQMGAFYNFIAFVSAFILVRFTKRYGAKNVHGICLALAGIGLFSLPFIHTTGMVYLPMFGMGLCWASMMGNPYIILAGSLPQNRIGVYMGVFNMFIVIPMMLQNLTMPLYYRSLLGDNPANAIKLAGVFFIFAALSVYFIKDESKKVPI
jgi:maltose/moltooligosaccharide transporter